MPSPMRVETKQHIELVLMALDEANGLALCSQDIAAKIGSGNGRNKEISHALKWLKRNKKIVQFSNGQKGGGSTYVRAKANGAASNIAIVGDALKNIPPSVITTTQHSIPAEKPHPVVMIEVPKATLKVLVKAVMACGTPMEGPVQKALLQCMEKLI